MLLLLTQKTSVLLCQNTWEETLINMSSFAHSPVTALYLKSKNTRLHVNHFQSQEVLIKPFPQQKLEISLKLFGYMEM